MSATSSTDAAWAEHAMSALATTGRRRGGARRAILAVLDRQACALSVQEIAQHLSREHRGVSRASIYRVIDELEQLGLLQRLELGRGVARYEPAGGEHAHHHHLVCDACGRVEPFSDDGLERAIRRIGQRLARPVADHEIVIHGSCRHCAAG